MAPSRTRTLLHRRPTSGPTGRGRRPAGQGAAITLVYIRPEAAAPTVLDASLAEVACRYGALVELQTIAPEDAERFARWAAPGSSTVLVVRRGAVIGHVMGDGLPAREIDRAVRRAVEWPVG